MTPDRVVPVKSWLTPSTYRVLDRRAQQQGMTVAELVSFAADNAAAPEPLSPAIRTREDRAARIRELHDLGWSPSAIAEEVGVARATVYRHIPTREGEH